MDVADFALSLALIGISVGAHIWIAYTKAGPKALAYVKKWFDNPEGQRALESYIMKAATRKDEKTGKSLLERVGHTATTSMIEFMGSEEGHKVMDSVMDAGGAVVTKRMQEWLGSILGHGAQAVDGLKGDLAKMGAAGGLVQMFAGMKGGQKMLKDPMVQGLMFLAQNMKGGNGGVGSGGVSGSPGGSW